MSFQVHALSESTFAKYLTLSAQELHERKSKRVVVDEHPGFCCRVSLEDVPVGETVLLANYQHLTHESPYQASHAVYVNPHAKQVKLAENELPESVLSRLIAIRGFSDAGILLDAEVIDGPKVALTIEKIFANRQVDFIHLHNAKFGCFSASVTRGV